LHFKPARELKRRVEELEDEVGAAGGGGGLRAQLAAAEGRARAAAAASARKDAAVRDMRERLEVGFGVSRFQN
jgi:hypothetical protein